MAKVRAGEQTPIRLARRERNAATTYATRARKIVPNELREGRQMRLDSKGKELEQLKTKVLL